MINKKSILGILLMLIFLLSCSPKINLQETKTYLTEQDIIQFCETLESDSESETMETNYCKAILLKDIEKCADIKNEDIKRSCYTIFAIEQKNPEICAKIDHPENCYRTLAVTLGEPSLCKKIPLAETGKNPQHWCLIFTAQKAKNEETCKKLEKYEIEENQNILKNTCYSILARQKQDPKLCEKAGERKEACYRAFELTKEEISKLDMLSCNKDSNPLNCIRNYLVNYYGVSDFKIPTPQECKQLEYKAARENCLRWLAFIKQDISICEKDDESCLAAIGGLIGDVSVCEKISEDMYKDHCFVNAARVTRTKKTCEKIGDEKMLFYCYNAVSQGINDELLRSLGLGLLNKHE